MKIKKSKGEVKFKLRLSKYLYTLKVTDMQKADKISQSFPPGGCQHVLWRRLGKLRDGCCPRVWFLSVCVCVLGARTGVCHVLVCTCVCHPCPSCVFLVRVRPVVVLRFTACCRVRVQA